MLRNKKLFYIALTMLYVFVLVLWSGVLLAPRGPHPIMNCQSNLRQLHMAIVNYHEVYHSFPPSFTSDENGRPMHSWRALVLPYLGGEPIPYNYDEPWDSPYNRQFHDKMPNLFCCPFTPKLSRKIAPSYVMVTGSNTVSDSQNSDSLKDTSFITTIMLVEIKNANFNWLEPVDIPLEQLQTAYRKPKNMSNLIGSYHNSATRNFNLLTCDGAVHSLSYRTTNIEVIRAMATIDGARYVIEKEDKKTGIKYFEFQDQKVIESKNGMGK